MLTAAAPNGVSPATWRTFLFVTVSVIALASAPRADADAECGAPAAGAVTCPVDLLGPDYPDGITYNAAEDLTINVDDGVAIAGTAGITLNNSAGNGAVAAPGVTIISDANGVAADNSGDGSASIDVTGSITGAGAFGVSATTAGAGAANAAFAGTMTMSSAGATGVLAQAAGAGDANAGVAGDVLLQGGGIGVRASSVDGAASVSATGAIIATGADSIGVQAESTGAGAATASAGAVAVSGDNAVGVRAISADGAATVNPNGVISVEGETAVTGIAATSSGESGSATVDGSGSVSADGGLGSIGIFAQSVGSGPVSVTYAGPIDVAGDVGVGVYAVAAEGDGPITLALDGAISAPGEQSNGVTADTNGAIVATLAGSVQGGWTEAPDPFVATGVTLRGGESVALTNNASLGSMSDSALTIQSPSATIDNNGTLTGFVSITGEAVTFNNSSSDSFDVRSFADTDGDGVRETEGVSISDFGGAGVFNNDAAGTVNLLNVGGATAWNTTGALLPEYGDPADYDITLEGVEQGQLTNLAQFNHAGSIVLQDGLTGGASPVAGDILAISGGEGGPAEFVSNGGSLWLDTVLDAGGASSTRSDVLILDSVTLGSGATQVFIANAGGEGAQTIDDGILLVDVLDPAASAADAFVLGSDDPLIVGAFQYQMFQGGDADNGGDPLDGNWYLRSDLAPTTDLYRAMPASMLRYGRNTIGTVQQRVGNRWWRVPERQIERTVTDPPPPPPVAPSCPSADFVVYFEWDRSDLNQEAQTTIDAALQRARQCGISNVQVIGHTDTSGSQEYNVGLSQRRASVVQGALVAGGVPTTAIQTDARGETDLARATPDGVREPLNRRAAVTIRLNAPTTVAGPPPAPRTRTVVETIPASVQIQGTGVWGRIGGSEGDFESDDENVVDVDESTWFAQAGYDFLLSANESGTVIGSVFGHYGEVDTDVANLAFGDIGSYEMTGYGIGGSVTWYSPGGAYADGTLTYSWLDNDLNSDTLGVLSSGGFDGEVWAVSGEGGYRYEVSPNYYVVPQAQLTYASVDFDGFTDPFGADVEIDDGDSLVGRLGVAFEYMSQGEAADDGSAGRMQAYGIANVYYEFMGDTGVTVDGISLQDNNDETWGELGAGLTYNFDTNWSVYAEGGYMTSLENWGDSEILRGSLGVRYNW